MGCDFLEKQPQVEPKGFNQISVDELVQALPDSVLISGTLRSNVPMAFEIPVYMFSHPTIQINPNAITLEYASKEDIQCLRLRPKTRIAQLEQAINDITSQLHILNEQDVLSTRERRNTKKLLKREILYNKIQELRKNQASLQVQLEAKMRELAEEKTILLHLSGALALRWINVK